MSPTFEMLNFFGYWFLLIVLMVLYTYIKFLRIENYILKLGDYAYGTLNCIRESTSSVAGHSSFFLNDFKMLKRKKEVK